MFDLSPQSGAKADIDQVAVTNRGFMSTRPLGRGGGRVMTGAGDAGLRQAMASAALGVVRDEAARVIAALADGSRVS
jgi:hypothetical protein